jgi:hypothetical protein
MRAMGSWGSGRWAYHCKATPVEDCRVLDLGELARKGAFVPRYAGSVSWLWGVVDGAAANRGPTSRLRGSKVSEGRGR